MPKAKLRPTAQPYWEAEMDAETLARAEEIKADQKRMTAATKAAEKKLKDKQAQVDGLKKIVRQGRK